MHRILVTICIGAILPSLSGCQSFSSTMLNRLGDNSFVGNSNGGAGCRNSARPFKGIPVALYVPSHLDVYIEEVYYIRDEGQDARQLADGLPSTRILNVRTNLIRTKKVFTVDYKRPMSGTRNTQSSFSDEQYFQSIASALQDTTIVDSANLLNTVLNGTTRPAVAVNPLPGVVPPVTPKPGEQPKPPDPVRPGPTAAQLASLSNHVRDTRVVAYRRFDLNEPDFEAQVDGFIEQQLNACNRCGTLPAYDTPAE